MTPEKLVHMANQIGKFFVTQRGDDAAEQIANHLRKFWDPSMRSAIAAHLDGGGQDLDEAVRMAVERLGPPSDPTDQAPARRHVAST
jgi:formate dehydrogenase subunit delta